MTATRATIDRAEINHRNSGRAPGPRTPEGKDRSRFNALKHGMSAKTLVLPGEDAGVLQRRIEHWTADLRSRSDSSGSWSSGRSIRHGSSSGPIAPRPPASIPSSSPRRPKRRSTRPTWPPPWASGSSGMIGGRCRLPPFPLRLPRPAPRLRLRARRRPRRFARACSSSSVHRRRLPMAARPLGRARRPAGPRLDLAVARQVQGDPSAGPATARCGRFGGGGADLPGVPRPRPPTPTRFGRRAGQGPGPGGGHPHARRDAQGRLLLASGRGGAAGGRPAGASPRRG